MVKKATELEKVLDETKPDEPVDVVALINKMQAQIDNLQTQLTQKDETIAAKDQAIDELKKKEEGWLVVCQNPLYNGTTNGILFTDGMAFIPKNRFYPKFAVTPLTEAQKQAILDDKVRHPHGEREIAHHAEIDKQLSSERLVKFLVSDFGYKAEYFTKDQMDELQKRINARAQERREAQAKIDKEGNAIEKMLLPHQV